SGSRASRCLFPTRATFTAPSGRQGPRGGRGPFPPNLGPKTKQSTMTATSISGKPRPNMVLPLPSLTPRARLLLKAELLALLLLQHPLTRQPVRHPLRPVLHGRQLRPVAHVEAMSASAEQMQLDRRSRRAVLLHEVEHGIEMALVVHRADHQHRRRVL